MSERKISLFRKLLWATTIAIGFGTIWAFLAAWLLSSIDEAIHGAERGKQIYEQLVVRSDGTPLIWSGPRENLSVATYRDLSGRALEAPDRDHQVSGLYMAGEHDQPGFFAIDQGWTNRLRLFFNEQGPAVFWYFVHDGKPDGAGYFVGFEETSNRRVGYIGLSGFRSDPVPIDLQIPVRGSLMMDFAQWSSAPISIYSGSAWAQGLRLGQSDLAPHFVYVPSGNRLRIADLAARTVRTVLETTEPIESIGIPMLSSFSLGRAARDPTIVVRTARQIHTLDRDYKITRVFTIPTEADRHSPMTWFDIEGGGAVVVFHRPGRTRIVSSAENRVIYRIAGDGTIQDRFEIDLRTGTAAMSEQMGGILQAAVLPAPALLIAVEPLFQQGADAYQSYPAALGGMLRRSWPTLLVVLAATVVLAAMAKRRSRGFGLSKREQLAWAGFVFLLGLPAYAGFLLHRSWPVRQRCLSCHALASRDRAACAHCGARFPAPALTGTEIFA